MKSLFFAICLMLCIATTVSAQTHTEVTIEDNQTISSNKTFTGNNTHSGTETFTGNVTATAGQNTLAAYNLNSIIFVDGVKYAQTNAGIQAAVNATPAGATVYLPTGTYPLTATSGEQIKITQSINFICAGWGTNLQLASTVGAIPVIHIVPSGGVNGIRIQDCQLSAASGTPGSYGIQVDTSPGNNISLFVVDHVAIGAPYGSVQFGTGGIWLNNTAGEVNGGFSNGTIQNSYISGGFLGTLIGDSVTLSGNTIRDVAGVSTNGVDVSFTPGSSSFRLLNGNITSHGAALHLGSAPMFTQIAGVETETPNSTTVGSNGAYVDIDGTVANPASAVDVSKNSFQIVNSSALNGLRINNSNFTNVRDNFFERGVGAKDIVTTANATKTRIRPNDFNGDTIANALSDGAAAGQTLYEFGGQNDSSVPLMYRDNTGTTTIAGFGGQAFGTGITGQNQILDGVTNSVALATNGGSPTATPAAGTIVSLRTVGGAEGACPVGTAAFDLLCADSTAHRWKFNNNNGGADTVVGAATTDTLTNKTLNTPFTSGTGLQIFNTTTTCTTAGSVGATCTTAAISLPIVEADTSYRVTCTGKGPTAVPVISSTANSSATQFTITIAALTAVAASFTSYDCIAGHN